MSEHRLVLVILCLLGGGGCYYAYKNSPNAAVAPQEQMKEWVPPSGPQFSVPPVAPPPELKPSPPEPESKPPQQPQRRSAPGGGGCRPGGN